MKPVILSPEYGVNKGRIMPLRLCSLLMAFLWVGAGAATATTIPFTGSFSDVPQSKWTVNLSGPGFSVATEYFIPFSRPIGAPPVGAVGTLSFSVGMSDYESGLDGSPSDSASLDGVEGIVEGSIDFQVMYDPSLPGDPASYAPSVGGIPVSFSGAATAYTCVPAPSGGCFDGTELWAVSLTGSGDATIMQSSDGRVESVEVSILSGVADPPVPAAEPSALAFLALALCVIFLLRPRAAR